MKLLAHTGFEFGKIWTTNNLLRVKSPTVVKNYVKSATNGVLEIEGPGDVWLQSRFNDIADVSTNFPQADSTSKGGSNLFLRSPRDTHLHLKQSVSKGFEMSVSSKRVNNITNTADLDFDLKFTINGKTYTLIWDENGMRLFDIGVSVTTPISPTDGSDTATGIKKTAVDISKFFAAQVWVDSTPNLHVRAVTKDNPADIVHWQISVTDTTFSNIEISSPSGGGIGNETLDDLTLYEIESGDSPAADTTTNDFQPALREVSVIAKSGTDSNVRFYFPDAPAPGDWKASTNGVESDQSDGADTTFAEAGLDRAGWEQWINSGADAIDQIPIKNSEGLDVSWGAIHQIALHHWRVEDDDGEDFTAGAEASSAIKQSDGTAHLIQTAQTKTLQGVIGQSGMLTASWDFSGLTGSDGVPIDETSLKDLKMTIKKA